MIERAVVRDTPPGIIIASEEEGRGPISRDSG
jgi:hypothetical protein